MISFPVFALEKVAPTDVDLRATYCLKTWQSNQQLFQGMVNDSVSKLTEKKREKESREFYEEQLSRANLLVNRLQRYIFSRIKFVDTDALNFAALQSQTDKKAIMSCIEKRSCSNFLKVGDEEVKKCMNSCNEETGGAMDKEKMCNELNWLPF